MEKKIVIVGSTCSGKTTLAKHLSRILKIPHIELDAIYWGPNWTAKPFPEFRKIVEKISTENSWIIEGNYMSVQNIVFSEAELVIWLNYSFPVVMHRALKRTIRRIISKELLFSGNRERFFEQFFTRDSLYWWLIKTYKKKKDNMRFIFDLDIYSNAKKVELKKNGEAQDFLNSFYQ
ncbi:MAG: adenylate kinase [Candidatus Cloacimonetes bacterium]|nr:adenylate kinase [Candidatus Cloacimonadota bacterium]